MVTKPPLPLLLLPPELDARALGGGGAVARKVPLERVAPDDAVPPEELLCASAESCSRQASSSATHRALHAMHRPIHRVMLRQEHAAFKNQSHSTCKQSQALSRKGQAGLLRGTA